MDWLGWATFGFGATIALTSIMAAAQLAGWSRMDMPMLLGTMFVEDPDRARVVGFVAHVMNGYVFASIYPPREHRAPRVRELHRSACSLHPQHHVDNDDRRLGR